MTVGVSSLRTIAVLELPAGMRRDAGDFVSLVGPTGLVIRARVLRANAIDAEVAIDGVVDMEDLSGWRIRPEVPEPVAARGPSKPARPIAAQADLFSF